MKLRFILLKDELDALQRLAQAEGVSEQELLRRLFLAEAVRKGLWPWAGEREDNDDDATQ